MKSSEKEIIIIGQGLAGSSLALELEECGILPLVIDNQHHQAASTIAAGLWNPVSFRNMKTVWMAAECLKLNAERYPRWEGKLGASFYHPTQLLRIHRDAEEVNNWDVGREKNPYLLHSQHSATLAHAGYGIGEVSDCGWVDVPRFIRSTAHYLK
ncbi:MAG: FAD-dependent oxidoreductase, partial [Flavobacteriales bacterium]